jgi:hypothetical protein
MRSWISLLKYRVVVVPKLNELQSSLNEILVINYGGCAFAAIAMYDLLVKFGQKPTIIYAYRGWDSADYISNTEAINNKSKDFKSCNHALIKLNGKFFDTTGERNIKQWEYYHEIPRKNVIDSLKTACWNPSFVRSVYLPIIYKKIGYAII